MSKIDIVLCFLALVLYFLALVMSLAIVIIIAIVCGMI